MHSLLVIHVFSWETVSRFLSPSKPQFGLTCDGNKPNMDLTCEKGSTRWGAPSIPRDGAPGQRRRFWGVWGLSQQDAPVGWMRWLREGTGFLPLQCPLCWPGLSGRVPRGSFFSNPMFISVFIFIYDF